MAVTPPAGLVHVPEDVNFCILTPEKIVPSGEVMPVDPFKTNVMVFLLAM
jgi:hypothetical protein